MANRTLKPAPGLSAPMVGSIPDGPLTGQWFRQFLTNYLNPYALQGTQGQAASQTSTTTTPPFTTTTNSPFNTQTTLSNTIGTTQATWAPCQSVNLPDAVAFNVSANGGVVDLLLNQVGTWGYGYVMRFDARSGKVAGQILKMTGGTMTNIGTAVAAANAAALSGTYRVVAVLGLNGAMSIYVDGALQTKATDNAYALSGATFAGIEASSAGIQVWAPTAIDGTLDFVADGAQYVHLVATHAAGNVAFNFQGVWAAGNSYVKGDEVLYGQTYWLAVANSTGSQPSTGNANWQFVASYNAFQGAWSATTAYVVGDEVTYSGNYWVSIAANTNSAPTTSNANWQIAGPTNLDQVADGSTYVRLKGTHAKGNVAYNFQGAWSSAVTYVQGDEVVYGPTFWLAIAGSTNSAPATGSVNWQAVGTYSGFQGAWSAATAYAAGAEVTYTGNYWICVTANTNSAPTTSNANWQVAGPTSLDNVADGSTYVRLKGSHARGNVAYNFQGAWASATTYNSGDEVSSGGNYYLCIAATTNNQPPNATYWQLLGPTTLDVLPDGSTYIRGVTPVSSAGAVSLNKSIIDAGAGTVTGRGPFAPGFDPSGTGNYWSCVNASLPTHFTVDLGYDYPQLKTLVISTWYANDNRNLPASGTVDVSQDNSTWTTGVASWSGATVGPIILPLVNYTARYVRINISAAPSSPGGLTTCAIGNCAIYAGMGNPAQHLDADILDGTTYLRMPGANMDANRRGLIDFSQGGHLNKILDNIGDGSTYARVKIGNLTSGNVDLSLSAVQNRTLQYIGDYAGGSRYAVASIDGNRLALIDFSQGGHLNKILDNIGDGSSYQRMALGDKTRTNIPYNGHFTQYANGQSYPDGWSSTELGGGGGITVGRSATGYNGLPYSVSLGPTGSNLGGGISSQPFAATGGQRYQLRVWMQSSVASPGSLFARIRWFNGDSASGSGTDPTYITDTDIVTAGGPASANTWTLFTGVVTAPPTAVQGRVNIYNWTSASAPTFLIGAASAGPATSMLNFGNNTAAAAWVHVGTLVLQGSSSATFRWHTGQGYNSGSNQQAMAEVTIRAGNDAVAPNISGISAIVNGNTQPLLAVRAVATGNSTSATNTSWEIFFECGSFTQGPLEAIVNYPGADNFVFDGSPSTPGTPASAYVNGYVGLYLNPVAGNGLDGVWEGSTYLRMPSPPSVSAAGTTSLSQSGTTTTINVGAATYYLGNVTVSANAGSVNPGSLGTWYVYFDSPGYAGGAVTYQATSSPIVLSQSPFRFVVGKITTASGGGGGGGTGGGGGSPCFSGDTRIVTTEGLKRFDELPEYFRVVNHTGCHDAQLIVHPGSTEPTRRMGANLVTTGHLLRVGDGWVPAGMLFHEQAPQLPRTLYNAHVLTGREEDRHYILENGLTAHNLKV